MDNWMIRMVYGRVTYRVNDIFITESGDVASIKVRAEYFRDFKEWIEYLQKIDAVVMVYINNKCVFKKCKVISSSISEDVNVTMTCAIDDGG